MKKEGLQGSQIWTTGIHIQFQPVPKAKSIYALGFHKTLFCSHNQLFLVYFGSRRVLLFVTKGVPTHATSSQSYFSPVSQHMSDVEYCIIKCCNLYNLDVICTIQIIICIHFEQYIQLPTSPSSTSVREVTGLKKDYAIYPQATEPSFHSKIARKSCLYLLFPLVSSHSLPTRIHFSSTFLSKVPLSRSLIWSFGKPMVDSLCFTWSISI